jgi:hypothetical protein
MTASLNGASNSRTRRGPRYAIPRELPDDPSAALREFRDLTAGLSNRLPLPSVEGMRAGTVNNPISLMRRFLVAMRSAGLPKERALRVQVWLQREIDALWPLDATPRRALEEKANRLEYIDGCAEKKLDLEYNAITVRERIQTKSDEVAADLLLLAKLEREMAMLEDAAK